MPLKSVINFPQRKTFEGKLFNSVVGFFLFADFAHDAQNLHNAEQNSWCLVCYKCLGVTTVRTLKVAGSNPAVGKYY